MAEIAVLLVVAMGPVGLLAVVFYFEDRHEPEPPANLAKYAGAGALACGAAFAVHGGLSGAGNVLPPLLMAIVFIGLVEECLKFAVFALAARRDRELDEPYDGCIYGAYVGLGFALVENLIYVFSAADFRSAFWIGVLRCTTAVPAHALFGALWGLGFGLARFQPRYRRLLPAALLVAVVGHGAYDFVAERSAKLGNNLLGYFALLAQLTLFAFAAIEGIHLAHRHSPHRRG